MKLMRPIPIEPPIGKGEWGTSAVDGAAPSTFHERKERRRRLKDLTGVSVKIQDDRLI